MKQDKIMAAVSAQAEGLGESWNLPGEAAQPERGSIATDIMNMMEQGILVWSADGFCELHNSRIYQVLELRGGDLSIGTKCSDFRDRSLARGEFDIASRAETDALIQAHRPYSFDRLLPSGRVVLTSGRPMRGGGYVVTYTDVSDARKAALELDAARLQAQEAEVRACDVLVQERSRQAEAKLLSQLDEWLQSCKSLDELFLIVARFMARLLVGSKGELYIYSNSRDALEGKCNWNTIDLHTTIAADSCWALRRGRSYKYQTDGLCFSCEHVEHHQHRVAVEEYICVPIVAHGDTVGLLHIRFDHLGEGSARIADKGNFAIRCGEHISMAIANVKLRDELRDQSIRDPLTGLYNRRFFMDAIRREISISERRGATFGVISFDADKFKLFNDNHGHDAGDMVLRAIGDKLAEVFAAGEISCRFGGEEFTVLVPAADLAATTALAERLRDAIATMPVRYMDGFLPRVTISIGVSAYPGSGLQPQELLRRADDALYRAKEAGRNCVRSDGDIA